MDNSPWMCMTTVNNYIDEERMITQARAPIDAWTQGAIKKNLTNRFQILIGQV